MCVCSVCERYTRVDRSLFSECGSLLSAVGFLESGEDNRYKVKKIRHTDEGHITVIGSLLARSQGWFPAVALATLSGGFLLPPPRSSVKECRWLWARLGVER